MVRFSRLLCVSSVVCAAIKAEIIQLGIHHALVTKHTRFALQCLLASLCCLVSWPFSNQKLSRSRFLFGLDPNAAGSVAVDATPVYVVSLPALPGPPVHWPAPAAFSPPVPLATRYSSAIVPTMMTPPAPFPAPAAAMPGLSVAWFDREWLT